MPCLHVLVAALGAGLCCQCPALPLTCHPLCLLLPHTQVLQGLWCMSSGSSYSSRARSCARAVCTAMQCSTCRLCACKLFSRAHVPMRDLHSLPACLPVLLPACILRAFGQGREARALAATRGNRRSCSCAHPGSHAMTLCLSRAVPAELGAVRRRRGRSLDHLSRRPASELRSPAPHWCPGSSARASVELLWP